MRKLLDLLRRAHARGVALGAASISLLAPALVAASEAASSSDATHHVNWWHWESAAPPVGWFFIDFLVLIGILGYLGRKPVRTAFLRRHQTIRRIITENEEAYARAQQQARDARDKLATVDEEMTLLISRIKEDGVLERGRIVENARSYAERLRSDIGTVIGQEATSAQRRLREEMARLVLQHAEAVLARELTMKDKARLLEEAIDELESGGEPAGEPSGRVHELRLKAVAGSGAAAGGIK